LRGRASPASRPGARNFPTEENIIMKIKTNIKAGDVSSGLSLGKKIPPVQP
jgi:hypothetical protein